MVELMSLAFINLQLILYNGPAEKKLSTHILDSLFFYRKIWLLPKFALNIFVIANKL